SPDMFLMLTALDSIDALMAHFANKQQQWGGTTKHFWGPGMVSLRQHPGFPDLLERSGLMAHYRSTGIVPDDCKWVGDDLDCTILNEP
ncbi:MAG: hypothetical protein AAGJ86_02040, partial [Pseudomonadota bacterium]